MHVCHLAKYYPPTAGGIESHVQTLARGQRQAGLDVTVACINHCDSAGKDVLRYPFAATDLTEECDEGVRVIRFGRKLSLSKWDFSPGLLRNLYKLSRSTPQIDLFHLHAPNVSMLLALYFNTQKTPLVVTHHSDIVKQVWAGLLVKTLEKRILRRAAVVLTTSPHYAGGSRQLAPFLPKVESLPLGTELGDYLRPSPIAIGYRDDLLKQYEGPIWLAVGRLVYYKGLATALNALAKIPGTLLIIGEGPERRSLEQRARDLGLAERIAWLGHVSGEQLVGAYHAATALLFPSNARSEAFGLVQVEAMASGCPVINTKIPHSGVSWVSMHEQTGLTVAMDDPQSLAAAALRILNEVGLRERLATAARQRAVDHFDATRMVERCSQIYDRVLSNTDTSNNSRTAAVDGGSTVRGTTVVGNGLLQSAMTW